MVHQHVHQALAGTLGLGKLIAVYDDNGISIDSDKGSIVQWYTDDVRRRFEAYGWQVIAGVDGHDIEAMDRALKKAKREARRTPGRPTLICAKTIIGKGAPTKANTGGAHGALHRLKNGGRAGCKHERSRGEGGITGLGRFVGGVRERPGDRLRGVETVARNDGAGVRQRGRLRRGGT